MGGVASLLTTPPIGADVRPVHVPGPVVNRARRASMGGEAKSDPCDAKTISDQLRPHPDSRVVTVDDEISLELRMLVTRRRELVVERAAVPGQARLAEFVGEFADAALVRSLPGMGATLTAELLAEAGVVTRFPNPDALASTAGLASVLQRSGAMRYPRRSTAGGRTPQFIFRQRERAEGKRPDQGLTALARRRVNVLHAITNSSTAVCHRHQAAITARWAPETARS